MESYYYSIASSSAGNCALYAQDGALLLIDLGVSLRALPRALDQVGLTPGQLTGVVLTHEHSDHVKGLEQFLKKTDVPVYATIGTAAALTRGRALPRALCTFDTGDRVRVGALTCESFATPHDAAQSVGYIVRGGERDLGFATDLGRMTGDILTALTGCETVVLESNHDRQMLLAGRYPYSLKQRILGERGHLSNEECARAACHLLRTGTRKVILAHLSQHNNTPIMAAETTLGRAAEEQLTVQYGREVRVAPVQSAVTRYLVGEESPC